MKLSDYSRIFVSAAVTALLGMSGWTLKTSFESSRDIGVVQEQVSSLKQQVTLTYTAVAAAGDNALRGLKDQEQDRRIEALETARRRAASSDAFPQ